MDKKQQSLQATVPVDKPNDHELENANDFGDTSDVDTSFTVKKSLLQIVNSADKALNTAGGLGEGTPKVSFIIVIYLMNSLLKLVTYLFI